MGGEGGGRSARACVRACTRRLTCPLLPDVNKQACVDKLLVEVEFLPPKRKRKRCHGVEIR
jgi:hypothetical protein